MQVAPVVIMKGYQERRTTASELYGAEWSASGPGGFTPEKEP